jgi:hypothetical protein
VLSKNSRNLNGVPEPVALCSPPLDVTSSMLFESVCRQLSSSEDVLLSSVSFCEVMFYWSGDFFYSWHDWSKNLDQILFHSLKKLLQKPTECYRKPSEIMPWAKHNFHMGQTLQGRTNVCRRRWAVWMTVDKHNTGKLGKSLWGYPCRS